MLEGVVIQGADTEILACAFKSTTYIPASTELSALSLVMAFEGQKQPRLTGYLRVFGNLSDPKEVEDDSQVSELN